MKKRIGPIKKRVDFQSNKLNKYSIRKFTVGTASILVGTAVLFGANKEAEASEIHTATFNDNQTNETNSVDSEGAPETETDVITKKNSVNKELPATPETQSETNVVSKDDQSQSNMSKTKEESPTVKSSEIKDEKTMQEDKSVDSTTEIASTVTTQDKENKNTPETSATGTESAPQPQIDNSKVETSTAINNEIASNKDMATPSASTNTEIFTKEKNNYAQSNRAIENIVNKPTAESKKTALANYIANNTNVSTEEAQASLKDMDIDFNNLTNKDVMAELLKSYAQKAEANSVYATAPRTFRRLAVTNPQGSAVAKPTSFAAVAATGQDVSNLVKANNMTLDVNPSGYSQNGVEEFRPKANGYMRAKFDFTVDDSVKAGDTFKMSFGEYLRPGTLTLPTDTYKIYYGNGSEVLANGVYDKATNTINYTFTDVVDKYDNIKGYVNMTAFNR